MQPKRRQARRAALSDNQMRALKTVAVHGGLIITMLDGTLLYELRNGSPVDGSFPEPIDAVIVKRLTRCGALVANDPGLVGETPQIYRVRTPDDPL